MQNCSLSETYCWTERISEWPSVPSPAHGPPRAPQAGHGPACPCAVPLDSLHLPAVGRDSKNPGLGLHHGTELRVLCPPVPLPTYASIHTQVSVLSRPSLRPPHSSLSLQAFPHPSSVRSSSMHLFTYLPVRYSPIRPAVHSPPPSITHQSTTHSFPHSCVHPPSIRPALTHPFPHSLVHGTLPGPGRSGCRRRVDTAGPALALLVVSRLAQGAAVLASAGAGAERGLGAGARPGARPGQPQPSRVRAPSCGRLPDLPQQGLQLPLRGRRTGLLRGRHERHVLLRHPVQRQRRPWPAAGGSRAPAAARRCLQPDALGSQPAVGSKGTPLCPVPAHPLHTPSPVGALCPFHSCLSPLPSGLGSRDAGQPADDLCSPWASTAPYSDPPLNPHPGTSSSRKPSLPAPSTS